MLLPRQEPYGQGNPKTICIHSLTAERPIFPRSRSATTQRLAGSAGPPHPPGHSSQPSGSAGQAPSQRAAADREEGQAAFPQCFHRVGAALEASATFVSGTGSSPGLFWLLLGEGMVRSCAVDLQSQFPLTVLVFFLKAHSAKLGEKK